jgi:hypothetical protein
MFLKFFYPFNFSSAPQGEVRRPAIQLIKLTNLRMVSYTAVFSTGSFDCQFGHLHSIWPLFSGHLSIIKDSISQSLGCPY